MRLHTLASTALVGMLVAGTPCQALSAAASSPHGDAFNAVAGSLPEALPVRRDEGSGNSAGGWRGWAGLGALALGAGGWAWLQSRRRRNLRGAVARPVAIVRLSSQALTPQASVHAVAWNGEEYLVGCTAQHVTLLSRRTAAATQEELA